MIILSSSSALTLTGIALACIWVRDFMSLRMSPSCKASRRALVYGAAILLTAVLIWTAAVGIGIEDFARRISSPLILVLLIAFHLLASGLSIWVRQTQNYNWMWVTALLPTPIVWFLLLEATVFSEHGQAAGAPHLVFFAVATLWASSMIVCVFRARHIEMPPADLDCAVLYGGLCHWLAICALPLALSVSP